MRLGLKGLEPRTADFEAPVHNFSESNNKFKRSDLEIIKEILVHKTSQEFISTWHTSLCKNNFCCIIYFANGSEVK